MKKPLLRILYTWINGKRIAVLDPDPPTPIGRVWEHRLADGRVVRTTQGTPP